MVGWPYGGVAQLVEHLLCKQGVVGSIPSASMLGCLWAALSAEAWMGQTICTMSRGKVQSRHVAVSPEGGMRHACVAVLALADAVVVACCALRAGCCVIFGSVNLVLVRRWLRWIAHRGNLVLQFVVLVRTRLMVFSVRRPYGPGAKRSGALNEC
jgi:hypothetical protein